MKKVCMHCEVYKKRNHLEGECRLKGPHYSGSFPVVFATCWCLKFTTKDEGQRIARAVPQSEAGRARTTKTLVHRATATAVSQ